MSTPAIVVSDACSALELDLAMEIREATLHNHELNTFGYRAECTPEQYERFTARAKELRQNKVIYDPHGA